MSRTTTTTRRGEIVCKRLEVSFTTPAKDKRRLEEPIACAGHVDDAGTFRAFIEVVGGTPHTGQIQGH